jgi:two-component system response regulator FlrC
MQRAVILAAGDTVEADALHLLSLPRAAKAPPANAVSASMEASKAGHMRDLEREHILETLAAVGGSRKLAGERLGMSERTLRHKLKQYRDAGLFSG